MKTRRTGNRNLASSRTFDGTPDPLTAGHERLIDHALSALTSACRAATAAERSHHAALGCIFADAIAAI